MGRPKHIIPHVRREMSLPADLLAKVDILLYSELEGKVPQGRFAELVANLLKAWLERQHGKA